MQLAYISLLSNLQIAIHDKSKQGQGDISFMGYVDVSVNKRLAANVRHNSVSPRDKLLDHRPISTVPSGLLPPYFLLVFLDPFWFVEWHGLHGFREVAPYDLQRCCIFQCFYYREPGTTLRLSEHKHICLLLLLHIFPDSAFACVFIKCVSINSGMQFDHIDYDHRECQFCADLESVRRSDYMLFAFFPILPHCSLKIKDMHSKARP